MDKILQTAGDDDAILGPIGPRTPAAPVPESVVTAPAAAPGDDEILRALSPDAATAIAGKTGVLSAAAEQQLREKAHAAATATKAATATAARAAHAGIVAAVPQVRTAARTAYAALSRNRKTVAMVGAGLVLAVALATGIPALLHAWTHHAAASKATLTAHVNPPRKTVVPPVASARKTVPVPARVPVPTPSPVAIAPASVPSTAATPPHPAVPVPLARPLPQPRMVAPRPPRIAVPHSSARAKAEAAKAAAALDAFFHHAPSHGGSGGT